MTDFDQTQFSGIYIWTSYQCSVCEKIYDIHKDAQVCFLSHKGQ